MATGWKQGIGFGYLLCSVTSFQSLGNICRILNSLAGCDGQMRKGREITRNGYESKQAVCIYEVTQLSLRL